MPHRMSILYAYMSQPHYELWLKQEENHGRVATKELFMKEFGTPLITFSADGRDGFHPLPQGSSIIVNFQYYNDLNKKFKLLSSVVDDVEILNKVYIPNKKIFGFFNMIINWVTSHLDL